MDETKQLICKKCKCNKFTIIKRRRTSKNAIIGSKGLRTYICLSCDSIQTEWEIIEESKVNIIRISEYTEKIEDLQKEIKRLQKNNSRMSAFIDDYYNKLLQ
tara:strand:- start:188 stop:493 length:306 start_codon:yes stop_codon:yes gene_type:complete